MRLGGSGENHRPETSLDELVRAASYGEVRAFERLMTIFWPKIYRLVLARIPNRADAEDLCQDIFWQAFNRIHTLKDEARFEPWLFRLALNRQRDHFRRNRLRSMFQRRLDDGDVDQPAAGRPNQRTSLDQLLKNEFWTEVRRFVRGLAPKEQEVFVLRYLEDMTIPEVAATLGKNENTVKTHLYRAVRKFKDQEGLIDLLREQAK